MTNGLYGIAVKKKNNETIEMYFVETDYLGSILDLHDATAL